MLEDVINDVKICEIRDALRRLLRVLVHQARTLRLHASGTTD